MNHSEEFTVYHKLRKVILMSTKEKGTDYKCSKDDLVSLMSGVFMFVFNKSNQFNIPTS